MVDAGESISNRQQRCKSCRSSVAGSDNNFVGFCGRVIELPSVEIITTVATLYALFGNDFKFLLTNIKADIYFDVLTILCLVIFLLEIGVSCVGKGDYMFHTFFYFDVISTVTLFLDLSWIYYAMYTIAEDSLMDAENASGLGSVSKAGKAGSQVARMLRIIRLVRLIRVAKLYKSLAARTQRVEDEPNDQDMYFEPGERSLHDDGPIEDESNDAEEEAEEESKIGKELTELTTRKVVYIILVMTIILPFLGEENYITRFRSEQTGLDGIADLATAVTRYNDTTWKRAYSHACLAYIADHRSGGLGQTEGEVNPASLVYIELPYPLFHTTQLDGRIFLDVACLGFKSCETALVLPEECAVNLISDMALEGIIITDELSSFYDLRPSERELFVSIFCSGQSDMNFGNVLTQKASECAPDKIRSFKAVYDKRQLSKLEAALSIVRTIFVCFVLMIGTLAINHDTNQLILRPIERMMKKMNKIRKNPLAATNMSDEDQEPQTNEREADQSSLSHAFNNWIHGKGKSQGESYETAILEKTIIKIGGLLALGFGEAGAEIIAKNMHTADGNINAMIDGRKLQAIFGFCDIRNFTDATEILKEKVMIFVNQIAEIVHGTVDQFSGCANKNIGDAFLLVWKFPERERPDGTKEQIIDNATSNKLADMALVSFVKVIAGISKSYVLAEYREIPEIIERMGTGWKVKMGFGLHVGWAIEGAIGSEYKIDASYLSPNVNMASRLEAATKQYGVSILISNDLYDIMSPQTQTYCRIIDRATVKGSKVPLGLYTVDLDPGRLQLPSRNPVTLNTKTTVFMQRQQRQIEKQKLWSSRTSISAMFETDPDIVSMREHLTKEFISAFRSGFRHYEAGEWHFAREIFVKTQYMLGVEDGPSTVLLHFMSGKNYIAPEDWLGYRELNEK